MQGKNEEVTIEVMQQTSMNGGVPNFIERDYMIHIPPTLSETSTVSKPMSRPPLVVVMHGGGATARYAIRDTAFTKLSDSFGFLCVFPEGLRANRKEPPLMVRNAQTWNDGSGRFFTGEHDIDDVSFLDAMLADVRRRFDIDSGRIYMTGFSNGASMTFRYALERPGLLAAIAPIAGGFWVEPPHANLSIRTLYITGTEDKYNPMERKPAPDGEPRPWDNPRISANETVRRWANVVGCSLESETVIIDQPPIRIARFGSRDSQSEFLFCTIEGMGHVWPGGHKPLPEERVGAYSDCLHASRLVFDFFMQSDNKLLDVSAASR